MKPISLISIIPSITLLNCLPVKISKASGGYGLSLVAFTPIVFGETGKIYIKGNWRFNNASRIVIKLKNDVFPDGEVVFDKKIKMNLDSIFEYDCTNCSFENEIMLQIEGESSTGGFITHSIGLSKTEATFLGDGGSITSDTNLLCYKPSEGWYETKETYNFINFDSFYMPDYYHKIDFSDFKINVDSDADKTLSCIPSIVILNASELFNGLAKNNSSTYTIPLKLIYLSTNQYSFELDQDLYVNKYTLEMSTTPGKDYVKTRHLYLPVNSMKNQNVYKFTFLLRGFGIDQDIVSHVFNIKAQRNIMGDCTNSEYCVVRKNI